MFCRNCGNKITPGSTSCEVCGANPFNGENYCPECGHICIPGDIKCVSCGTPLLPPIVETTPPPITQPQSQPQSQQTSQNTINTSGPKMTATGQCYCRNCGLIIPADTATCPYCEAVNGQGNNYCPSCGSGTIATDSVCPVCSAKLTPTAQQQTVKVDYIPSAPPAAPQQQYQQRQQGSAYNQYNQYNTVNNYNNNKEGKSRDIAILLGILPALFGFCGIHRLYTGHIGIGLLQLFTGGMCGIWQLIDVIMILTGSFRDSEGKNLS